MWSCWWAQSTVRKVHAPQTHQSVVEISRNTGICRSSVGRIIHDLFRTTQPRGKQYIYSVDDVFSGSVATQLMWGGKLCMHLEARNVRFLCPKLQRSVQDIFTYRRKPSGHFLRHMVLLTWTDTMFSKTRHRKWLRCRWRVCIDDERYQREYLFYRISKNIYNWADCSLLIATCNCNALYSY